jgi:hypothetical protein
LLESVFLLLESVFLSIESVFLLLLVDQPEVFLLLLVDKPGCSNANSFDESNFVESKAVWPFIKTSARLR